MAMLRRHCYGSYTFATLLWQLCFGGYAMAAKLWWLCYGSYALASMYWQHHRYWQLCNGSSPAMAISKRQKATYFLICIIITTLIVSVTLTLVYNCFTMLWCTAVAALLWQLGSSSMAALLWWLCYGNYVLAIS